MLCIIYITGKSYGIEMWKVCIPILNGAGELKNDGYLNSKANIGIPKEIGNYWSYKKALNSTREKFPVSLELFEQGKVEDQVIKNNKKGKKYIKLN